MIDIIVFGEDYAHEVILRTLLERLAEEYKVQWGFTSVAPREATPA